MSFKYFRQKYRRKNWRFCAKSKITRYLKIRNFPQTAALIIRASFCKENLIQKAHGLI
jgi:hypothetical protein